MDIQQFIESGQLEAYVQGLLSLEEMQEIDNLAGNHPEINKELEEIRNSIQAYGALNPQAKAPSLDSVKALLREQEKHAVPSISGSTPSRSLSWMPWLVAASIVLLVASAGINWYLFQENVRLNDRVTLLETQESYLAQQYEVSKLSPEVITNRARILESSQILRVPLVGLQTDSDLKATVFMDSLSKEVYIHIEKLPDPPEGHQYQLWAIKDGVSLDAGIFDFHSEIQRLRPMALDVQAFAVTLEEIGGSPLPNLEQMYVKGEVPRV
ncbi:MAG: anti-sigma factor [Bacteroidota bacterium]